MFLEALGAFDPPQRHQQQGEQTGAQSIKGRAERAVDRLRAFKYTADDQDRHRQEHSRTRNCGSATKQRSRVLQQSQARQQAVGYTITRIGVVAGRGRLLGLARKSGQVWVPSLDGAQHQLGLYWRRLFPSRATQLFADGLGADTHEPGNFTVGLASSSQLLDPLEATGRQARPAVRVAAFAPQGGQASLIETLLLPAHGAGSVAEDPGHIVLIGPSLIHQADHGVRLSHSVGECILCQNDPRNDDDAVPTLRSDETPIVADLKTIGVMKVGKEFLRFCGSHIPEDTPHSQKGTGLGPHPCAHIRSPNPSVKESRKTATTLSGQGFDRSEG